MEFLSNPDNDESYIPYNKKLVQHILQLETEGVLSKVTCPTAEGNSTAFIKGTFAGKKFTISFYLSAGSNQIQSSLRTNQIHLLASIVTGKASKQVLEEVKNNNSDFYAPAGIEFTLTNEQERQVLSNRYAAVFNNNIITGPQATNSLKAVANPEELFEPDTQNYVTVSRNKYNKSKFSKIFKNNDKKQKKSSINDKSKGVKREVIPLNNIKSEVGNTQSNINNNILSEIANNSSSSSSSSSSKINIEEIIEAAKDEEVISVHSEEESEVSYNPSGVDF